MSVSVSVNIGLTVTETFETVDVPLVDSTDAKWKAKLAQVSTLNGSSTPDAEMHADMQVAMVAGAATIDFSALTRRGAAVSFSGKAVRAIVFRNPATNANDITIVEGAANGLPLLGANFRIVLKPGHVFAAYLDDDGPTVGAADKTIDISGTGTQALQMLAVAG